MSLLRSAPVILNLFGEEWICNRCQNCHVAVAIIFSWARTGQVMLICARTSQHRLHARIALQVLQLCPARIWTRETLGTTTTTMVTFKNMAYSDGAVWLSQETCQHARNDQRAVPSIQHSKRGISHSINEVVFDQTIRSTLLTMPRRAVRMWCWMKVQLNLESTKHRTTH